MEDEFCFSDGPLGLVIAKDRDRHVVCCVVRNSQAAALGVQCGSVLLRIAGQDKAPSDFDSLDIMDVNRQLEQMRRPLTLRLRRPGENWSPNTTARLASARLEEERKLAVSISKAAESGRVRSIKFGEGPLGISLQQLGDAVLVLSVDAHSQAAELKTPLGVIVGINGNSVWGRSKTEVSMTIAQSSRPMTMQIRSAADETLEEPTVPDPAFARVAANIFAAEKAAEKAAEMRALVEASAIECSNEARAVAEKAMAQAKMLRRESASSGQPVAPRLSADAQASAAQHSAAQHSAAQQSAAQPMTSSTAPSTAAAAAVEAPTSPVTDPSVAKVLTFSSGGTIPRPPLGTASPTEALIFAHRKALAEALAPGAPSTASDAYKGATAPATALSLNTAPLLQSSSPSATAPATALPALSPKTAPSPNTAPDAPSMHAKTERCVERHVMDVEAQPLEGVKHAVARAEALCAQRLWLVQAEAKAAEAKAKGGSRGGSPAVLNEPTDSARARAHLQKSLQLARCPGQLARCAGQLAPPSLPATASLAPQPPPYAHKAVLPVDMPPLPPPPVAVAAAARLASPAVVHEALNPARAREALMKTFGPRAQDGAKPSDGAQYGARSGAQYGAMAARGTTAANGASAQYGARFGAHNGAATTANGVASAAAAVPVARLPRPPSTHAPAALPLLSSEAAAIACAGAEAAAQAAAKARAAGAVAGVLLDAATPTTAPKAASGGAPATTPGTDEAPRTRNEGVVLGVAQAPASAQLPPSAHASRKISQISPVPYLISQISPVPYLNLPDRTPPAQGAAGDGAGDGAGEGAGGEAPNMAPNDAAAAHDAAAADARDDAEEAAVTPSQIVPAAVSPTASVAALVPFTALEPFTVTFKDGWHYEHVRGETFTPSDFTPSDAGAPWEGEAPTTTPKAGSGSASMHRRSHRRSSPAEQRAHPAVRVAVSYASPPPLEPEPLPVGGRFGVQLPSPSAQLLAPSAQLPAPSAGGVGKGGAAPTLAVPPLRLAALAALAASARAALSSGARNGARNELGSGSRAQHGANSAPHSASARVLLPLEAVEAVAGTFRETMTPRGETLITRKGVETKATFFEQFSSRLSDGVMATFGRFSSRREPEGSRGELRGADCMQSDCMQRGAEGSRGELRGADCMQSDCMPRGAEGSRGEAEVSQQASLSSSFASSRSEPEPEWLTSAAEHLRQGHPVESDRVPEALGSRDAEPLRDGGASVDESLLSRSSLEICPEIRPEICPEICPEIRPEMAYRGEATSSSYCRGAEAESAELGAEAESAASVASVASAYNDEATTPNATTILSPQPPPSVHPAAGSAFPTASAAASGPLALIPLAAANVVAFANANATARHQGSLAATKSHQGSLAATKSHQGSLASTKSHHGSLAATKGAGLPTISPCGVARHGIAARRLPPARTAVPSMRIGAGVGLTKVGAAGRADALLSTASSAAPADTPERERRAHDAIRAIAAATAAAHPLLLRGEQVERSFEEFDGRDASYYERCA